MKSPELRVDRSAFSVVPLSEADDDLAFWLSKTPEERLRGVEVTRRILYGYTDPAPRFQRVFEIVKRE